MKAYTFSRYGNPKSVLELKEVAKPIPSADEVLIHVKAAAINDYDWSMVRGNPFLYRLMFGFFKPKKQIPGMELSGIVEAVGTKVTTLKPGDSVYGDISDDRFGAFAEYITVKETSVVIKPDSISFTEATTVSHAAMLAWQGLFDTGKLTNNQKVLINGAGGGMGTFAIQLAKIYTSEVTGVDSKQKLEQMRLLGCNHVIDYKTEDFTSRKHHSSYDLILDAKTNRFVFSYLKALKPNGKYITVGGSLPKLLQLFVFKWWIAKLTKKTVHIVSLKTNKDLKKFTELYVENKMKTVIDGPHPFHELPELIQYFGDGNHKGKVVVTP